MDQLIAGGHDLNKIRAVFLSHLHSDHTFGLPHMINLASWYYQEMRFQVLMPEERGIRTFRQFCQDIHPITDRVSFGLIRAGVCYDDGVLRVTAIPTAHMMPPAGRSWSFLLEAEGKRVCITGDLSATMEDFPAFADPVDLLIPECAHFPAERLLERLRCANVKAAAPIHVFPTEKYAVLASGAARLPFPLRFPADGETVALE